jgi:hypothetical protein
MTQRVAPGRRFRRRARLVVALIGGFVLVYALVVSLYAFSGRVVGFGEASPEPDKGGIGLDITPDGVNAAAETMSINVSLVPSDELLAEDGLTLAKTVHVVLAPTDRDQIITFRAGTVPAAVSANIVLDGAVEDWPFDSYRTDHLLIAAYTGDTPQTRKALARPAIDMHGYVPGWSIGAHENKNVIDKEEVKGTALAHIVAIKLDATRSGSTIAFAVVLLALMIVMPVLVLFVAITALRGIRKVEASFMSWMAAMLFATIPLRTFLPGSPPIGSWVDFLIVLWVVVGLVTGLAIYVTAWWHWGLRGERADPATRDERRRPR